MSRRISRMHRIVLLYVCSNTRVSAVVAVLKPTCGVFCGDSLAIYSMTHVFVSFLGFGKQCDIALSLNILCNFFQTFLISFQVKSFQFLSPHFLWFRTASDAYLLLYRRSVTGHVSSQMFEYHCNSLPVLYCFLRIHFYGYLATPVHEKIRQWP